MDPRIEKLAHTLVNHSVDVKKGEIVLIKSGTLALPLVKAVYKEILLAGGYPRLKLTFDDAEYYYLKYGSDDNSFSEIDYYEAKQCDALIVIRAPENTRHLSSIDTKKIMNVMKTNKKIKEVFLREKKWVLTDYPTEALAQESDMSLEEYEDFVFASSFIDWDKQEKFHNKIKEIFDASSQVRLIAPDTDLTFSLKERNGVSSLGHNNMPDGEVFYSPIKDTVEGHIKFSYPAIRQGKEIDDITLEFKEGKVVNATAKKNEEFLIAALDTDEGSRYIGEFGIGLNYNVQRYVKNLLFDEKIGGTIHLALGAAFPECGGKNVSALHWDIVKDFRKEGEIFADEICVFKNGKWQIND